MKNLFRSIVIKPGMMFVVKHGLANTRLVCWQFGYKKESKIRHYFMHTTNNTKAWGNDIECTGNEESLRTCRLKYRSSLQCRRLVHVHCEGNGTYV